MNDPVEEVFREVAMMTPAPPKDEDPYQSDEYAAFVESMIPHCHCADRYKPCDGVLSGGVCDGMRDDEVDYKEDDDDGLDNEKITRPPTT